ncbi:alpha/beta hydrolase [Streptacidiphilus sp. N1-3]|uniref:Alpha/beta hydrolase n=1 Tax=Streptacidiphilus alkalitolerans TaxID=3342712 RepID=A0ABV6WXS9_9ACTN
MDLTSSRLEYAAGLLTLVCVCATVWLWPRLARRGVHWIAARLGMILASQLSVVLLVALMLNSYGDFYPTWHDLVGGSDGTVTIGRASGEEQAASLHGSKLVLAADSAALRRQPGLPQGPADQVGRYDAVTVVGTRSGISQQAYVYLPPQYFQARFQHTAFPVLTSYVGYPGSIQGVLAVLKLQQGAAKQMAAGRMQATVVVLISQTVAPPRDTDCVDVVGGPKVETYLSGDYRAALRSAYRVRPEPGAWGLIGFSEGGTCALETTMRHPDMFGAAVSLGGEYSDYETGQTGTLFGPAGPARTSLLNSYNLLWRLRNLAAPNVKVLVATTAHGERDYPATEEFLRLVRPPMQATPMVLSSGGHNFTTWQLELGPALTWISRQLLPPGPVAEPPAPRASATATASAAASRQARPAPQHRPVAEQPAVPG